MIKSRIRKFILSAFLTGTLLVGSETVAFAKNVSMDYNETYDSSHMTRSDMQKIPEQQKNPEFKVPQFDFSTIKNIESAKGVDNEGNPVDLDVWDSWPLQNADGTVANYNGYNINFALAGDPKDSGDTFVYMFYQKIGDTSIDSWKSAGRVFEDTDKNVPNDPFLKNQIEEWSGSATLTSDGEVRLFYTDRQSTDAPTYGKQILTTAQVNISKPTADTLKIDGVEDQKSIFDGADGKTYQNVLQSVGLEKDNHTFRDPHYVEENGKKYLVFEANTGTETGYQGEESLYNSAYYGPSNAFFQTEKNKLLQSSKKDYAALANGALGIIELNDDYTLKEVMKPLITSNTITDEIERANVFEMNGKWYLFTDSRGSKMTIDGVGKNDVYMLGYVSDSLTGEYKPLNDTGLVLNMNQDPMDPTFTYSHFVVPQPDSDNVVITSYMTNRGYFEDKKSTFAPSFLMNIKGSKTSVVPNSILDQGQLSIEPNAQKK